jgi:hypothetical protein
METVCQKIVVVRCGEQEPESLVSGTLSDDGEWQMKIAGKKLKSLLKKNIVALIYPGSHWHLMQSASIIGSALKVKCEALKRGYTPWNASNPALCAKQLSEKADAIVLIAGVRDLQRFQREFLHAGFQNISAHLSNQSHGEGTHIFGPGTFWCADLTKRTIFCGRARCKPYSDTDGWVDRI